MQMQTEELSPEELTSLLAGFMPEIPGYRVIRRIGRGGMSHVYLGVQVSLDRQVAIKVMSPEALTDEKSKARFEHEAHTIAKLEHPCIVGIHEVGRTPQGLLYYVLPYLARGHLGQRDFTQDEPRIVEVLRALLSALEYAHTRGIVHRDVKAENVLFDNADRPLLTDFGIALSRHDTSRITTAGLAVGSGGYMSPEQARGEAVDGRADLYSVGVLAFELLMGRLPFLSPDPLGLALMHAQDPIPRLPPERRHWQAFIDRAMAKSPDNRFRNAQQMLGALHQIPIRERAAPGEAAPSLPPPKASLLAHPWARPVVSALLGAAVLLLVLAMFRGRNDHPAAAGPQDGGAPVPVAAAPAPADDFFTGRDPPAQPAPATGTAPEPATAAAAGSPAVPLPALAPAVAAETSLPAATPDAAHSNDAFASARGESVVTTLAWDPAAPGARALHAVDAQLAQTRLGTPAGDNAIESVLAARAAGADPARLDAAADAVLDAYAKVLPAALAGKRDAIAKTGFERARAFAKQTGRLQGKSWLGLRDAVATAVHRRLAAAHAAQDAAAVATVRTLAGALAVDAHALEPEWSRALPIAKAGKAITGGGGPAAVLVVPPAGKREGVAFMRHEVSRADYAAFASSTNRPSAHCRNRLAPISFKRRSWASPGFPQTGDHPAVCVSYEDARAYAAWLSQRTGETWRLPTAAEWKQIAAYRGTGSACGDGRVDCGQAGTIGAGLGPQSPLGLTGVRGNAREWLNDCDGSCRQHLVGGLGWRDNASRAEPLRSSGFDARTGFDDVGFRLVREVGAQ